MRDQVSAVWPIDRIEEATTALKAGEVTRAALDQTDRWTQSVWRFDTDL